MDFSTFLNRAEHFLRYIVEWESQLPTLELSSLVSDPRRVAIISVDVINGFCYTGPLASPRIKRIISPIVSLFRQAHAAGVRHFILSQEAHEPDALEFQSYPPHCVKGTDEAGTVPEIKALPFYKDMVIIPKNSIQPALNTRLEDWLKRHPEVNTFIAVGDCTDLCTYQLAMHLRLRANASQLRQRVIVPGDCTDTYDLPVEAARQINAVPHDGDLLHLIFLYSMMLNGVEVVRSIV